MSAADPFTAACPVWRNSDRLRANAMPLCAWNEVATYPRPSVIWPVVRVFLAGSFGVLLGLALIVWVFA